MSGWQEFAVCRSDNWADRWYPDGYQKPADREQVKEAQRKCFGECPVQTECLAAAVKVETGSGVYARHGIWGGLTPDQRESFIRAKTREEKTAVILRAVRLAGFVLLDVAA